MDGGYRQSGGLIAALQVSGGDTLGLEAGNELLTKTIGGTAGLEFHIGPQSRRRDGHVKWPAAQRRGVVVQAARGHRNEVHQAFAAHMNSHIFHSIGDMKGDEVKRGDVLAEFDIDAIKAAGLPVTTPVVVSNSKKTGPVIPTEAFRPAELIGSGTDIFTVDPKPAVVPVQTASPASESAS